MRLKYQLFFTLLIASALLIAIMFLVSSWTFSRGFLGYVNSADRARISEVVAQLETIYEEDGSWEATEKRSSGSREIRRILRPTSGPRVQRANRREEGGPRKPPPSGGLILADEQKNVLLGRMPSGREVQWEPLKSGETVVGFLGYKVQTKVSREFDQAFERQQRRTFGLAAVVLTLLSGILAVPIAARVVKPILEVNSAVEEISQGRYDHRVEIKRDDEIGDLAANINKLGTTLEDNLAHRKRWVAEISHELRTPVSVLRAELEALEDGIRKLDSDSVLSLKSEVLRLSRLIDDLHSLSLSEVGAMQYSMDSVSLVDVLNRTLETAAVQLQEKGLSVSMLEPDGVENIQGDELRLEQLFTNLLQNSIRYTDSPGNIEIGIIRNNAGFEVKWADSGPGVSDDELRRIFEPLYRAEKSRNRELGGAGLGLSIVKKIVQAHKGSIESGHSSMGGLELRITFLVDSTNFV